MRGGSDVMGVREGEGGWNARIGTKTLAGSL